MDAEPLSETAEPSELSSDRFLIQPEVLEKYQRDDQEHLDQVMEETPGFIRMLTKQVTRDGIKPATVGKLMTFVPLAPDRDCPCRSGKPFETCCLPARFRRLFVRDPDGFFSPVQVNEEVITNIPFEEMKHGLNQSDCFYNTEDTAESGFWHYRPEMESEEEVPELFGTVELSRTGDGTAELFLSTLSSVRYRTIRDQIEAVTDSTLPQGNHRSSLITLNEDQTDGTLDSERSNGLLTRYQEFRESMKPIHNNIIDEIATEDDFMYVAEELNMVSSNGDIIFESEAQANLLKDLCVYDIRRNGKPLHYHWWNRNRPETDHESTMCNAMENAWVSIIEIQEIFSDHVVAVVRGPERNGRKIHLVDRGMIETAPSEVSFISRFLPFPDFHIMSGGWGYIVKETDRVTITEEYRNRIENTHWRKKTYETIRFCQEYDLSSIHLSG